VFVEAEADADCAGEAHCPAPDGRDDHQDRRTGPPDVGSVAPHPDPLIPLPSR
jgi:hypothetical protein